MVKPEIVPAKLIDELIKLPETCPTCTPDLFGVAGVALKKSSPDIDVGI